LFHNSNVFGSCIIHILYTGCAKIKKQLRHQKVNYLAVNKQCLIFLIDFFLPWRHSPQWIRASLLLKIRNHTQTHHTRWDSSGRVISSSQRPQPDNTQHSQRQTSMPPVGFEPTTPASERPQNNALDRADTGTVLLID